MLNAAVVGLGRWGQTLVSSVQNESKLIRFAAAVARTPEKVQDYADEQGLKVYAQYEDMLADPAIEAVVLATPHSIHGDQARAAAAAGKHVYIEKPMTLTYADAVSAAKACEDAGVLMAVGFSRRYAPAMLELYRLVAAGEIGELLHMEGQLSGVTGYRLAQDSWRATRAEAPGGGMTARGVHVLDAMIALAGPAASVQALSERRVIEVELDDVTAMLAKFGGGASGYMSTIFATAEYWRFQALGSTGWAEVRSNTELVTNDLDGNTEVMTFDPVNLSHDSLEGFARAVAGDEPYPVTTEQALAGVALFEALIHAADTGDTVTVPGN